MNRTNFSNLLTLSSRLSLEETEQIASIVKEFPYFQAARALYLKGLKNQESFKYNKSLKTTAAYTTNRSILFDFITSDSFVQNAVAEKIKQNHEGLKTIPVLDFEDISIQSSSVTNNLEVEDKKEEELLNLGMPLKFDKGEAHSFSQWLKLTKISPILSKDFKTLAKRPNYSVLDNNLVKELLNFQGEHWKYTLKKSFERHFVL